MRALSKLISGIGHLLMVPGDNPVLLKAQCAALSRLIPLMYFILLVNSWMLVASFFDKAPLGLTVHISLLLTAGCSIRLFMWFRTRGDTLSSGEALRELRRTRPLTVFLGLAFSAWAIALFPYGDAWAQGHVAFYLSISLITTMFCLIHVRSSALLIAAVAGPIMVGFMLFQGTTTFVAIAVNITLVTVAATIVVVIQSRAFEDMILAQQQTEALGRENLRIANLDSLTALPNRRAFFAELRTSFAEAQSEGSRLALGIIDLDGFKPVNDLYGHSVGDRLLIEVASRLVAGEVTGTLFLSRLGGDEFAFLVPDCPDDPMLTAIGNEICSLLEAPVILPDATVQISGSVGIAVFPEMATTPEQLFERADYALYHAKNAQRGTTILFSSEHAAEINQDAAIEQALRLADIENELSVVFQPIVDIRSQRIAGFEALARWQSPVLGQVSPTRFIQVAERAGIISHLTRPLLGKALATAAQWPDHLRLSVNLSAHDLNSSENVILLVGIIERSGFDPTRLDLEITETAIAYDFHSVQESVRFLRLLGCGISLDDFGTGYSSLARLHSLPFTKIKIDRRFVTGLHNSPASFKIVKSLIALSKDMGIDCVIEGVETGEELAALKQLGGSMVQGHYYSAAVAPERVSALLAGRAA